MFLLSLTAGQHLGGHHLGGIGGGGILPHYSPLGYGTGTYNYCYATNMHKNY